MTTMTFTKIAAPAWLLAMWKEIDDKTFGKGFDCFAEDAVCNLGVADGTAARRSATTCAQFIDKGFTAHHDVVEYWDSPTLKIFHGKVTMTFDDPAIKPVRPTMTHFFYMDENRSDQGLAMGRMRSDRPGSEIGSCRVPVGEAVTHIFTPVIKSWDGLCLVFRRLSSRGSNRLTPTLPAFAQAGGAEGDAARFNRWINQLVQTNGKDLLRTKGIVDIAGEQRRLVFHGVHMTLDGRPGKPWSPTEARINELVFIGRNLDAVMLRAGFAECRADAIASAA